MIAPIYIAGISPAFSSGFLTSLPKAFINLGTLLGYISHYVFSKFRRDLGWCVMLYVGATPWSYSPLGPSSCQNSPMAHHAGPPRRLLRLEAAGIPEACNDDVVKDQLRPPPPSCHYPSSFLVETTLPPAARSPHRRFARATREQCPSPGSSHCPMPLCPITAPLPTQLPP
ncbi:hypothetical protein NL676_039701 [Syzygium grande]|nr:hypothetical protein NL676_039701 [Syzygium grande]